MHRQPLLIESEIEVKSYDIDINDHVSNIVYIRWLEDFRLKLLDRWLPYKGLLDEGLSLFLIRTEIDYKRAISMFEPVLGRVWISGFEGIRMHIHFSFEVNGQIRAQARQIAVFYDLARRRPARPPRDFLSRFEASSK